MSRAGVNGYGLLFHPNLRILPGGGQGIFRSYGLIYSGCGNCPAGYAGKYNATAIAGHIRVTGGIMRKFNQNYEIDKIIGIIFSNFWKCFTLALIYA